MKLELIPHETCPTCAAITVAESCMHRHTCGEGFEERTFECGCVIAWSPNFSRLETKKPCPKLPAQREKVRKQVVAVKVLMTTIDDQDVDEEFKNRIRSQLRYLV